MTENAGAEKQTAPDGRLASLATAVGATKLRGPAPVEKWNPAYCGEIDIRIAGDGTWFYNGTPIRRAPLVALFASVLRKDPERYVLVTPVERLGIVVDDVPFVAVAMATQNGALRFVTNVGDEVEAGEDHPLRFATESNGGVKPYVHIRGGLEARLTRTLAIDLIDTATTEADTIGIRSGAVFFPIGPADLAA